MLTSSGKRTILHDVLSPRAPPFNGLSGLDGSF
jgi:hypothetical protein